MSGAASGLSSAKSLVPVRPYAVARAAAGSARERRGSGNRNRDEGDGCFRPGSTCGGREKRISRFFVKIKKR